MLANTPRIQDLEGLREYVSEIICEQNELELGAYPMTERLLLRGEKPCGIFFCLHGPRSVKLTAIWETDRNTLLFYGSVGERLEKIQLGQAPTLRTAAA
jgi:hypothetical protein